MWSHVLEHTVTADTQRHNNGSECNVSCQSSDGNQLLSDDIYSEKVQLSLLLWPTFLRWTSFNIHKPSLRAYKPAYFEPVRKPRNTEDCSRNGIRYKNTLRCTAGLILAFNCVAAAGLLAVIHIVRGVSERGPAINQGPHQIQNKASIKLLAVIHTVRGVSERGPAINQGPHQIQNKASIKEVWVLVFGFFMFLSAVSPGSPYY